MTDKEYIEGIWNKDNRVFATMYETFRSDFINLFRIKHSAQDVEQILDAYQDSCVVVWNNIQERKLTVRKLEEYNTSLKTYLFSIGRNKLVNTYRRTQKEIKTDNLELFSVRRSSNNLSDDYRNSQFLLQEEELSEREIIIQQLVTDMQEPCNTLLKLYYWEKKDGRQIAELLNYKNADSVKTQKFKCMKKLKAALMNCLKEFHYDK